MKSILLTELEAWMKSACACETRACVQEQREAFWDLVQEFRDDVPSEEKARTLSGLIERGQACLESLQVDIYALN